MQKWEYLTTDVNFMTFPARAVSANGMNLRPAKNVNEEGVPLQSWLEKVGSDGWELVASAHSGSLTIMMFKRPKQ